MKSALFWDFMQWKMLVCYRRFRTTYPSLLQGSWLLEIGPIVCPKAFGKISEESRSNRTLCWPTQSLTASHHVIHHHAAYWRIRYCKIQSCHSSVAGNLCVVWCCAVCRWVSGPWHQELLTYWHSIMSHKTWIFKHKTDLYIIQFVYKMWFTVQACESHVKKYK